MTKEQIEDLGREIAGRGLRIHAHACPLHGFSAVLVLRGGLHLEARGADVPNAMRNVVDFWDEVRARVPGFPEPTGPRCRKCGDPSRTRICGGCQS